MQRRLAVAVRWLHVYLSMVSVETLRRRHQVRGAQSDYRTDGPQIAASLKGPAYAADAFVDRARDVSAVLLVACHGGGCPGTSPLGTLPIVGSLRTGCVEARRARAA